MSIFLDKKTSKTVTGISGRKIMGLLDKKPLNPVKTGEKNEKVLSMLKMLVSRGILRKKQNVW